LINKNNIRSNKAPPLSSTDDNCTKEQIHSTKINTCFDRKTILLDFIKRKGSATLQITNRRMQKNELKQFFLILGKQYLVK